MLTRDKNKPIQTDIGTYDNTIIILLSSPLIDMFPAIFSRVSTLMHDIDIAILSVRPSVRLSVRHVLVFYCNGLTYCHSFFTTR